MTEKLSAAIDVAVDRDPLLLRDALEAVLSVCAPEPVEGDDMAAHALLDEGFATCKHAVSVAIAKALKVSYP
jgi:hypothetical protein